MDMIYASLNHVEDTMELDERIDAYNRKLDAYYDGLVGVTVRRHARGEFVAKKIPITNVDRERLMRVFKDNNFRLYITLQHGNPTGDSQEAFYERQDKADWVYNEVQYLWVAKQHAIENNETDYLRQFMKFYRLLFKIENSVCDQAVAAIAINEDVNEVAEEFRYKCSQDMGCEVTLHADLIPVEHYRVLVRYIGPITPELEY